MLQGDTRSGRPALALVPAPESPAPAPTVSFCSHCGARPGTGLRHSASRVCRTCELGLLLECNEDHAPPVDGAFLVLDAALSVCAVSAAAERLLAARETDTVNHPVTELIVPADAEAQGGESLAVAVTWAARGDDGTRRVVVRPANTFGVRLAAQITACGPPRAALLVFETERR